MAVKHLIKRTVYVEPLMWEALVNAADFHNTSVSTIIRSAMDEWLDREAHSDHGIDWYAPPLDLAN